MSIIRAVPFNTEVSLGGKNTFLMKFRIPTIVILHQTNSIVETPQQHIGHIRVFSFAGF